ncbi:hypothetical protein HMPREF9372_2629 [Sporosarcina newyorkensis 2681]|uniref:Uncharacterized protein n=1 Tax=Sporosarcina newyorkensis 2681 TaxID=1027292 RepID=F9DUZ8_9BACL|nr:hypothetical protein [Sporosarcina newyorkensis]EGQ23783.1 hypothetical protein HMPREF9372_2629 [Sporosarcina newyorkensis 2681]
MALVDCGNCTPFDSGSVVSFDCVDNTFLVKLLSIGRDIAKNQTILTYELCSCGGVNFNQFYFKLCPEGQGPQLNVQATKDANDPSTDANFVGIKGPNQAQNPFDSNAALFTSANKNCQKAILVYNGIFEDSQIQVGNEAIAGRKGQDDYFASVAGLFNCAEEPPTPGCADINCPIDREVETFCCFKTTGNISPTNVVEDTVTANGITFDPSNLTCQAEPFCVADIGPIETGCGTISGNCMVEVYAIRVTGNLPYVASFEVSNAEVCPENPSVSNISCQGVVCVDTIVCLSCDPDICPDFCQIEAEAEARLQVTDDCGNAIWIADITFTFPGCE